MKRIKHANCSLEELEFSIREGKFNPVYLFLGNETFLIDETVKLIIDLAVEASVRSFNVDVLYGGDMDTKTVVGFASSFPMMADRRVVVVKEFDNLGNKEAIVSYIERPSPSTILVLIANRPDFRQKLYQTLSAHSTAVEFNQMSENGILHWITNRVEKLGKRITPEACQVILMLVGRSLREIQNEIDKLCIFVGSNESIDVDDVNSVVGMSKQYNIFELQKAMGRKDMPRAMEILNGMLDSGESAIGMVVMLMRYFQKGWLLQELQGRGASDYQLASDVQVSPFFVKDYLIAAGAYSSLGLERCFKALLDADEMLKSSPTDPKLVMTLLLHRCLDSEESLQIP